MIFERTAHEQAVENVRRALREELREDLPDRAESLVAIAADYDITNDETVQWVHFSAPEKRWTVAEFVRWSKKLAEARAELRALYEREAAEWSKVCPDCFAHVAMRVGPRWICPQCGEVN